MNTPSAIFKRRDGSKFVRVFRTAKKCRNAVKAWRAKKGIAKIISL